MYYIEPLTTISKAAQAIVLPWVTNPYSMSQCLEDQCIDDPVRNKLEVKVEEAIDRLLHEPEFLRTLQPRMQSLFSPPESDSSQQTAIARPVVENSLSRIIPSTSRIDTRPPDLDLHSQIQSPTQTANHSNITVKQQPDSNRRLSPSIPSFIKYLHYRMICLCIVKVKIQKRSIQH